MQGVWDGEQVPTLTWHKFAGLHDQVIACLPDEGDHLGRSVVLARVLPDEQHSMEHRLEQLCESSEVIH